MFVKRGGVLGTENMKSKIGRNIDDGEPPVREEGRGGGKGGLLRSVAQKGTDSKCLGRRFSNRPGNLFNGIS